MKKFVAGILSALMLLALCACGYTEEAADETQTPAFRLSVSFETENDESVSDDGRVFTESIMSAAVASSHSRDSAKRINRALEELNESLHADAQEIWLAAQEELAAGAEPELPEEEPAEAPAYFYNAKAEVLRCDTRVLSIGWFISGYAGGEHGFTKLVTLNFDSRTGKTLDIDAISPQPEKLGAFLVNYLVSLAGGEEYEVNGERVIDEDDRLSENLPELIAGGSWYFGEDALVVYANPYEIASFDAGRIDFAIPYAVVGEFLDSRFLPETHEGESGIILAEDGDKCDRGNLTVLRSITLDEGAQSVILSAQETVYNVKLYTLTWEEDGDGERTSLWNRNYMSTNDAVEVISYIPDVFPLVYIDYTLSDGTVITRGISQSGENGDILLVES